MVALNDQQHQNSSTSTPYQNSDLANSEFKNQSQQKSTERIHGNDCVNNSKKGNVRIEYDPHTCGLSQTQRELVLEYLRSLSHLFQANENLRINLVSSSESNRNILSLVDLARAGQLTAIRHVQKFNRRCESLGLKFHVVTSHSPKSSAYGDMSRALERLDYYREIRVAKEAAKRKAGVFGRFG